MYSIHDVFYWSTPADSVPPWRCSGKDRLEEVLASIGYQKRVAWVEHEGRINLAVGLRDNRDKDGHKAALIVMRDALRTLTDGTNIKCDIINPMLGCGCYILVSEE